MGSIFRKGSAETGQAGALAQEQAATARVSRELGSEFAGQTKPLRMAGIKALEDFFTTGQAPGFLDIASTSQPLAGIAQPAFRPLTETFQPAAALSLPGLEETQGRLREQLMAGGARGGLLQQQLGQVALQGGIQRSGLMREDLLRRSGLAAQDVLRQEQRDVSERGLLQQDVLRQEERDIARAGLRQQLFGGGLEYGTGGLSLGLQGVGQATSGLGSAASQLSALGAQRMAQNAQAQQAIGKLLGTVTGAGAFYGAPAPSANSLGGAKLAR